MAYDFSEFKKKAGDLAEHLSKELSAIHTGRASSAILDGIFIESYGAQLAVQHVATIASEDARTLRIVPWEKANGKEIEKAINDANLGISVSTDESGLRIFFPPLTTERRASFTKLLRDKVESARVTLKGVREQTKNDIVSAEKDGDMSEDEKTRSLEALQKFVDEANNNLESIGDKKEKEIMGE
ncbi:MAG: ribosome recycling factor [Candidatus Yonathbacteria bacterium CG10_big_fil_rev_8_21_14_0_10_43_136]|uniref:Ribosome recycling factor n=1 Tax=Candidatus Yonathbacteria bacterium CG_4_10_14_0_8_um_filter_43_17 TaxID=1975099 RepID=A0A2M7Q5B1_9BACT|nr:MAG: ribosome recycling factor [Candidatus Yonathbacteria bacterium CG17_big_fil_post_rev_8_21_14_2_50_43_9]PIR40954.1 MAG: ribosome recycling factor [Candidatus Yonathbacteria bacterium CG10_big_fil_rev_8_21_14_0_10_43_136]PIX57408.1 MAG: ribosome recycling factor [Candidatus Yonathbacteria bacterium CG_4_10_14_3_um_filter_43_12]PIY58250.1 MAG: ribosome recycling factor [Candidatus Yonathbacteria bacterium CG_4_10_14_0_8_um_filter_43_17]PJC22257.1 MAG: ribosome recycling factor [Candidatus 